MTRLGFEKHFQACFVLQLDNFLLQIMIQMAALFVLFEATAQRRFGLARALAACCACTAPTASTTRRRRRRSFNTKWSSLTASDFNHLEQELLGGACSQRQQSSFCQLWKLHSRITCLSSSSISSSRSRKILEAAAFTVSFHFLSFLLQVCFVLLDMIINN